MTRTQNLADQEVVRVINSTGVSPIVLVCEHASAHIPAEFENLGLDAKARKSHIAWDPGALAVAEVMSAELDARLVASGISRLVYDCNRPPKSAGAMPARSEVHDIPGNANLSSEQRADRIDRFYRPFHAQVAETLAATPQSVLVTIHSFTRVYHGAPREVEIGVLHDQDTRLADAMLATAEAIDDHIIRRNEPYGPQDGVTHMLQKHGVQPGRPNVMIEVRNDLITTAHEQQEMGRQLAGWLATAAAQFIGAVA